MRARLSLIPLVALLLCSCDPIPLRLHIAERVIGGTILYVDASAPLGGDGSSWATAFRYLQDALQVAGLLRSQTGWAPRVHIAEGVYYPDDIDNVEPWTPQLTSFEATTHLRLYGGFPSGGGTRDPAAYVTVLSGDIDQNDIVNANGVTENPTDIIGINANTVFLILAAGDEFSPDIEEDTLVDGVTICGGGILGGLRATASEGGICSVTLSNLEIRGNIGGGMTVQASDNGVCAPRLERIVLRRNAGGMFNAGGVTVETFRGGRCSPVLINVSFRENTSGAAGGGAAFDARGGTISATLVNTRFEGNSKGLVCTVDAGSHNSVTIVNSVFVGNTSGYGGAIEAQGDVTIGHTGVLELSLINTSFSRNSASAQGGAVSAVYCSVQFDNCVLWNDSATAGGNEVYLSTGAFATYRSCDVAGSGGSSSWNSTIGTDGGGNIDQNPLFTTTPNPGDGDWTTWADNNYGNLAPQAGSPAGNAGQSTLLPPDAYDLDADGNTSERIPIDLAGSAREQGANVDMGAYESQ